MILRRSALLGDRTCVFRQSILQRAREVRATVRTFAPHAPTAFPSRVDHLRNSLSCPLLIVVKKIADSGAARLAVTLKLTLDHATRRHLRHSVTKVMGVKKTSIYNPLASNTETQRIKHF